MVALSPLRRRRRAYMSAATIGTDWVRNAVVGAGFGLTVVLGINFRRLSGVKIARIETAGAPTPGLLLGAIVLLFCISLGLASFDLYWWVVGPAAISFTLVVTFGRCSTASVAGSSIVDTEAKFNEIIHAPLRLRICGLLQSVHRIDFAVLRSTLQISGASLSKHLKMLIEAGFVETTISASAARKDFRRLTWLPSLRLAAMSSTPILSNSGSLQQDSPLRERLRMIAAAQAVRLIYDHQTVAPSARS